MVFSSGGSYSKKEEKEKEGKKETRKKKKRERRRKEGRKKKNKFGGWRWREPSSNHHCWELELSYKPLRFKHKQRLACLGEGLG
jgi:hypothetical protein